MPLIARITPVASVLLLALGLSACASAPPHLESLVVVAEAEANHNQATAVDLVFVFDEKLLPLMPSHSLAWFEQRSAFVDAAGAGIEVVTMDVPPAMMAHVPLPARGAKALAVLVYANYAGGTGQVAGNITGHREVEIRLSKEAVIYGGK